MTRQVTFNPYGITVRVREGESLLSAALDAGVHIDASCGGEGVCGKCKVILESGEIDSAHSELLSTEDWAMGFRQACQSRVKSDVVVRIPPASLLESQTLTRRRSGIALRPAPIDLNELKRAGLYNPAFQKRFVKLPPPTPANKFCDDSSFLWNRAPLHSAFTLHAHGLQCSPGTRPGFWPRNTRPHIHQLRKFRIQLCGRGHCRGDFGVRGL